jgi:hypothetical protein
MCGAAPQGAQKTDDGEVVEWLKAPASKAGVPDEGTVSSNLTLSAIKEQSPARMRWALFFYLVMCLELTVPSSAQ